MSRLTKQQKALRRNLLSVGLMMVGLVMTLGIWGYEVIKYPAMRYQGAWILSAGAVLAGLGTVRILSIIERLREEEDAK